MHFCLSLNVVWVIGSQNIYQKLYLILTNLDQLRWTLKIQFIQKIRLFNVGSVREAHVTITEYMQIYIQNMQTDTYRKQGKAQETVPMCLTLKKLLLRSMRQDCIIISADMAGCTQLFCVRLGLCGSQMDNFIWSPSRGNLNPLHMDRPEKWAYKTYSRSLEYMHLRPTLKFIKSTLLIRLISCQMN